MGRTTLLVIGLIVGGAIGWFTAPRPAVDINVGGVNIQVQGDKSGGSVTANENGDSMQVSVGDRSSSLLAQPGWRALIFAIVGGIVGLVISAVIGRRKTA
ncbi:MAG: hypothetical protein ABI399_09645 [Bauldia sp.]